MTLNKTKPLSAKGAEVETTVAAPIKSGLQVKHCLATLVLVPDERRGLLTKVAVGTAGSLGYGTEARGRGRQAGCYLPIRTNTKQ